MGKFFEVETCFIEVLRRVQPLHPSFMVVPEQ